MQNLLLFGQIITSTVLMGLILVQARGKGLGRTFGGSSPNSFSRRGLENLIFRLTFIFSALFVIISLGTLLL